MIYKDRVEARLATNSQYGKQRFVRLVWKFIWSQALHISIMWAYYTVRIFCDSQLSSPSKHRMKECERGLSVAEGFGLFLRLVFLLARIHPVTGESERIYRYQSKQVTLIARIVVSRSTSIEGSCRLGHRKVKQFFSFFWIFPLRYQRVTLHCPILFLWSFPFSLLLRLFEGVPSVLFFGVPGPRRDPRERREVDEVFRLHS